MQLAWRISPSVTCYHAANQVRLGRHLLNAELESALRGPVEKLQESLVEERLRAENFWQIVIPIAAEFSLPRQLAETALTKLMGSVEAKPRVGRFERDLIGIRSAFLQNQKAAPEAAAELLKHAWAKYGEGLLGGIEHWTEAGVLVENASVFVMPNLSGGGGEAHAVFNSVRVEQLADSAMEAVHLAWLLGQLNLDVPRFSELVPGENRHLIAGLSMIPVAFAAAEFAEIAECTPEMMNHAVEAWLGPSEQVPHWQKCVVDWWEVYKLQRPPWPAAMQALAGLVG